MLTKKEKLLHQKECSANFIKATRDGFLFAKKDPAQAVSIMKKYLSENDLNNIDLDKSLSITLPYLGNEKNCGMMHPERVISFLQWLVDHSLEDKIILTQDLFTNDSLS